MKRRFTIITTALCLALSLQGCVFTEVNTERVEEEVARKEAEEAAKEQAQQTEDEQESDTVQSAVDEQQTEDLVPELEQITAVEPLSDVQSAEENKYTCTYDGIDHDFILEFPEQIKGAPLIVMLHGYGGSAAGFKTDIGIEAVANENGYAVVYVTGAPNAKDATSANGWNSGIGDCDNRDAEFLVALVQYLENEYGLDETRTYAVGFSNGAFMIHRLALQCGSTFEAFVSVAGMMPESMWNARPQDISVSFLQVTGQKDDVVPKNSDGSADHSKAPAIEAVIEYYVSMDGLDKADEEQIGKKATLTKYSNSSDQGDKIVWDVFIPDGRHSWPDENITGIDMNGLIMDFFEAQ